MKAKEVSEICEKNNNFQFNWKQTVLKPLLIGASFGVGYYLASLFLKTEIMNNLMEEAKNAKLAMIKLSNWTFASLSINLINYKGKMILFVQLFDTIRYKHSSGKKLK